MSTERKHIGHTLAQEICASLSIPWMPAVYGADSTYVFTQDSKLPTDLNLLPLYRSGRYIQECLQTPQIQIEFAGNKGFFLPHIIDVPNTQEIHIEYGHRQIQDEGFHLIVAAAGRGTRMKGLTEKTPKPLLPISGIPILTKLIKTLDRADEVINISTLVNPDPQDYKDAFGSWRQNFPDVELYGQESTPMHDLLTLAMTGDPRLTLIVAGDKWIESSQNGVNNILSEVKKRLVSYPVVLVGKLSQSAGRRIELDDEGKITSLTRASDNDSLGHGFGLMMIAIDCGRLPISLDICGDKLTDFLTLIVQADIPVGICEIDNDSWWANLNDSDDLNRVQTKTQPISCNMTQVDVLKGGRSGSVVEVVRDNESNQTLVRKSFENGIPMDEVGVTERMAASMDKLLFGTGANISQSTKCEKCGLVECVLMEYHKEQTLDSLIMKSDYPRVDAARNFLLRSMHENGYFAQKHMGSSEKSWQQWLMNRQDLIRALITENAHNSHLSPDLADTTIDAIEFLLSEVVVPMGFFPRDLNPGNIFIDGENNMSVIDQTMLFGSPAIVPPKLLIGWRRLVNTQTDGAERPDLSTLEKETKNILELDREFLSEFAGMYEKNSGTLINVLKEVGACQIIRHARGIMHIVSKNPAEQDNINAAIEPFLQKDIRLFKTGHI